MRLSGSNEARDEAHQMGLAMRMQLTNRLTRQAEVVFYFSLSLISTQNNCITYPSRAISVRVGLVADLTHASINWSVSQLNPSPR